MRRSIKKLLRAIASFFISTEKNPEFIDKIGEYDQAEIVKGNVTHGGGGGG